LADQVATAKPGALHFKRSNHNGDVEMSKISCLAAALLLGVETAAWAGDDHDHAAKFGGKVVEVGEHVYEVVTKDGVIEVHIDHHDEAGADVKSAKGTATILSDGKTEVVQLTAATPDVLKGTGAFKASPGTTVVVSISMPDHEPEQVRVKLD
jgi:hypothetical protein